MQRLLKQNRHKICRGKGLVYEQCISGLWDRVKYPERFRIYINQRQQFNNRNGMVKFDDTVGPQDGRISLTVSWEEAKEQTEFGKQYLEHAEEHYSKKVKNRYRILDKELLTKDGHELHSCIHCSCHRPIFLRR